MENRQIVSLLQEIGKSLSRIVVLLEFIVGEMQKNPPK